MKEDQVSDRTNVQTKSTPSAEISRVAVMAISISAGAIGVWAVACMIAGISNSGDPVGLVYSLFKAIIG